MSQPTPDIVLSGRLIDPGGQGLSGLLVRAFDFDPGRKAQLLGEAQTDPEGAFVLRAPRSAAGGAGERNPEPFLLIMSASGAELLTQTGWVAMTGDAHDFGALTVPVGQRPAAATETPGADGSPSVTPNQAPDPLDPSRPVGRPTVHGSKTRDFLVPRSPFFQGAYGRLFRGLPSWVPPGATDTEKSESVRRLAAVMVETVEEAQDAARDNPGLPAAYTYFGQFVDHDLTFDPTSSLDKLNDPEQLLNFRTPRFDLDNLYGRGPDDMPYLYDRRPGRAGHFVFGQGRDAAFGAGDETLDLEILRPNGEDDLPRNRQGLAVIGDPRNDENLIVAQLQLAFLKLHNRVVDDVLEGGFSGQEAFTRAQSLVRWHYQWVVLFDFLRRLVGDEVLAEVLPRDGDVFKPRLRFYRFKSTPFMPVEFSAAAYRYGHSSVRERYDLNDVVRGVPIFVPPTSRPGPLADLRGFRPLPAAWSVNWAHFVESGSHTPQLSRLIDGKLTPALAAIPAGPGGSNALAFLNLQRGVRVGLPSGQAVARAMGAPTAYTNADLGIDPAAAGSETPLWLYLLKEAEREQAGRRLGWVGARLVAEVFVGLAAHDPNGFLKANPRWTPQTASPSGGPYMHVQGEALELRDLLRHAGVLP